MIVRVPPLLVMTSQYLLHRGQYPQKILILFPVSMFRCHCENDELDISFDKNEIVEKWLLTEKRLVHVFKHVRFWKENVHVQHAYNFLPVTQKNQNDILERLQGVMHSWMTINFTCWLIIKWNSLIQLLPCLNHYYNEHYIFKIVIAMKYCTYKII